MIASEHTPSWDRRDANGMTAWLHGATGIDVGAGDGTAKWSKRYGANVRQWDLRQGDGDGTLLDGVPDGSQDFIFSSHLLEHLVHPELALRNWVRVVKPGGHLLIVVPHRDLYEKKERLPSQFNQNHLRFYLPDRDAPPDTVGYLPWLRSQQEALGFEVLALQTGDWGYRRTPATAPPTMQFDIDGLLRKESHGSR